MSKTRTNNGRYAKGASGNPNGRPVEKLYMPTQDELRKAYLRPLYKKHKVNLGGKLTKASVRDLIYQKLLNHALEGDLRAILKVQEIEAKIIEHVTFDKNRLLKTISEIEQKQRDNPEMITEEMLDLMAQCRHLIEDTAELD